MSICWSLPPTSTFRAAAASRLSAGWDGGSSAGMSSAGGGGSAGSGSVAWEGSPHSQGRKKSRKMMASDKPMCFPIADSSFRIRVEGNSFISLCTACPKDDDKSKKACYTIAIIFFP